MIIEENEKLAGDQSNHINLKVKGNDENEMLFRIRRSTRLHKLMNAYCNRQSFDINSIKFLFNGYHVRADQTPLELDMEDGAQIDAMIDGSHELIYKAVPRFQPGSRNDSSPYVGLRSGPGIHNVVGNSTNFVTVCLPYSGVNDKQTGCCATHLIDEDGTINGVGLDNFIKKVKLGESGASYAVVAIMGPQCSGKSTLLNHLFHTNFGEMDACKGRSPTTKGLWIAKGAGTEPCTIVMDLQGTDESEQGEDDTAFEKQSVRFVLAISDIMIINMWCRDIGLEQAASKRLLRTIFQVMWQSSIPHKTSLMFVIRDQTSTPLEYLEPVLREDIQKIWDSIPKPEAYKHTSLSEIFNVQFVALSSYEDGAEQFKNQVASLREKLFQSIITPGGLVADRQGTVPASGFSLSAQQIWKCIKENKDIDLPAHKVLVANALREEFANGKYSSSVAIKAEVRTFSKRRKARPWTTNEETVLAEAWISTGSQRLSDSFWKQVLEYFRKQMGDTDRTVHQMNSKWKVMEQKITKFNDIYHRMTKHSNDQSEAGILHLTHLEYRRSNNKPFPNEAAWTIVKHHPKWSTSTATVPPVDAHIQPQKRLKTPEAESNNHTTSSDAQDAQSSGQDNEEDERFNDEEPEIQLQIPQQRQNTPASSSSRQQDREEVLRKIVSEVTEISHIIREDLKDKKRHRLKLEEIKLEKVRIMEEQLQRKQKEKDLQFYLQPHEHLTGMQLKVALQCKEEITRRWGWE